VTLVAFSHTSLLSSHSRGPVAVGPANEAALFRRASPPELVQSLAFAHLAPVNIAAFDPGHNWQAKYGIQSPPLSYCSGAMLGIKPLLTGLWASVCAAAHLHIWFERCAGQDIRGSIRSTCMPDLGLVIQASRRDAL